DERMPDQRELQEPADERQRRESQHRPDHREEPFAVVRVEVLARERRRLAGEHDEEQAEGVDADEERPEEAEAEQDIAERAAVERGREDRVLREKACKRGYSDEPERAGEERGARPR